MGLLAVHDQPLFRQHRVHDRRVHPLVVADVVLLQLLLAQLSQGRARLLLVFLLVVGCIMFFYAC